MNTCSRSGSGRGMDVPDSGEEGGVRGGAGLGWLLAPPSILTVSWSPPPPPPRPCRRPRPRAAPRPPASSSRTSRAPSWRGCSSTPRRTAATSSTSAPTAPSPSRPAATGCCLTSSARWPAPRTTTAATTGRRSAARGRPRTRPSPAPAASTSSGSSPAERAASHPTPSAPMESRRR